MDKFVRFECTVKATSAEHAKNIFRLAGSRLLHVHGWCGLTDCLLSSSDVRDLQGVPVTRPVRTEDYINLTNEEMRPFGWMQVVYVAEFEEENGGEVALLARPVQLPFAAEREDDLETRPTLLRVVRRGLDVTAALVMEANPLTTVFERLGVYAVQWRSLVNGMLNNLTPLDESPLAGPLRAETRLA